MSLPPWGLSLLPSDASLDLPLLYDLITFNFSRLDTCLCRPTDQEFPTSALLTRQVCHSLPGHDA